MVEQRLVHDCLRCRCNSAVLSDKRLIEPLKEKKMPAVLPEAFRRAAKFNLENARRGFDMLMAASERAWSDEARPLLSQSGVAALVQEMTRLARSNVDANFDAAQKLIDAEDFERAFRLCVEHMQERLTAFTRQLQEVSSLTPDKAAPTTQTEDRQRQTSRQVRSIGEETTAAAKHQSDDAPTPKKKHREAARSRQTTPPTFADTLDIRQTKAGTAAARTTAPRVIETKGSSRKVSPKGGKRETSRDKRDKNVKS
jgi:hypothetical protein